jgi:hypothetical protein
VKEKMREGARREGEDEREGGRVGGSLMRCVRGANYLYKKGPTQITGMSSPSLPPALPPSSPSLLPPSPFLSFPYLQRLVMSAPL